MFQSNLEAEVGEEFVDNGFIIRQVASQAAFDEINDIFFHLIQKNWKKDRRPRTLVE